MASAEEIDKIGIAPATRLAMVRAIDRLAHRPDYLLIDWVRLPQCPLPQESFVKADLHSVAVAAASILAKVARDDILRQADVAFPGYGFAAHKGYGTAAHLAALTERGPCALHRHSFAPIGRRASLFDGSGGSVNRVESGTFNDGAQAARGSVTASCESP
jgi:ribonuclease HII